MTDEAQQNIHPDLFNHMDSETEISLTVTHDAEIRLGLHGLWLQSGLDVIYNNMLQAHRDQEGIRCEWTYAKDGTSYPSCGNRNGFIYCPYCGKKIKE